MSVKDLLDERNFVFRVERAFGKPYETNDTMVIPVGLVAGGFGGGGGTHPSEDPAATGSDGYGGGQGGFVLPLGAYVVSDGKVRWVPVIDATRVLLGVLAVVRLLIKRRHSRT